MSSCPSPGLVCCKTLRSWQSISSGRVPLWMIWSWSLGKGCQRWSQVGARTSYLTTTCFLSVSIFLMLCCFLLEVRFCISTEESLPEVFFIGELRFFMMKTQIVHVVSDLGPENTNMSRIQFHLFFLKMKIISKLGSKDLLRNECLRSADPPSSWTLNPTVGFLWTCHGVLCGIFRWNLGVFFFIFFLLEQVSPRIIWKVESRSRSSRFFSSGFS